MGCFFAMNILYSLNKLEIFSHETIIQVKSDETPFYLFEPLIHHL